MADNLSVAATADTRELRAQLALAQADLRAFGAKTNKLDTAGFIHLRAAPAAPGYDAYTMAPFGSSNIKNILPPDPCSVTQIYALNPAEGGCK
jgi:hypothetical protein